MFCPTCSQQLSDNLRYCSRCGTRLDLIADYLSNPDKQLQREKQSITGITLILITVFMLLINFIIYGATSLPHLTSKRFFFWLWMINILTSIIIGGIGLSKLIRSGFLRELKERELRIQMVELEQKYKKVGGGETDKRGEVNESKKVIEPGSVTEATTMRLLARQEQEGKQG
jgi:hypothetical protein